MNTLTSNLFPKSSEWHTDEISSPNYSSERLEGCDTIKLSGDHSRVARTTTVRRTSKNDAQIFPVKLMHILQLIDTKEPELAHIISWQPNGTTFRIHDKTQFEKLVRERGFFNQKSYSSFRRQLNLWGFKKIGNRCAANCGVYGHPLFLKENPSLCHGITRSGRISRSAEMKVLLDQLTKADEDIEETVRDHVLSANKITTSFYGTPFLKGEVNEDYDLMNNRNNNSGESFVKATFWDEIESIHLQFEKQPIHVQKKYNRRQNAYSEKHATQCATPTFQPFDLAHDFEPLDLDKEIPPLSPSVCAYINDVFGS